MYFIEPLLNRYYRKKMRSVLDFDTAGRFPVPPRPADDRDDCLLYVHIPFCESLCPYCSFHRYEYERQQARSYFEALCRELQMYRDLGYDFTGMYIGGGTPTIDMDGLTRILGLTRELFSLREISIETNPNHLTDAHLGLLEKSGIHRLSVGVQSFDDRVLKKIGRYEKYGSGREIREKLKRVIGRFDTLNVDLIFNMPVQTVESLRNDLDIIGELLPEQVTFYPLMTAPSVEATLCRSLGPIDYKKEKRFYFTILDRMTKQYTDSTAWCFSRKASMIDEYIIAYEKYVGAGSGAFGYFNDCIYINTFNVEEYIRKVQKGEFPVERVKRFTPRENLHYFLLMKLFGVSLPRAAFETPQGRRYRQALWLELLLLRLSGAIRQTPEAIELTDRGKYYWVMAMREFFIAVDTMRDHCRSLADL